MTSGSNVKGPAAPMGTAGQAIFNSNQTEARLLLPNAPFAGAD